MVGVCIVVEKKEVEWFIALFVMNWTSFLKVKEEVRNEQAVCSLQLFALKRKVLSYLQVSGLAKNEVSA